MQERTKIAYLEYIRCFSTIAVVFLHIAATITANCRVEEIGVRAYSILSDCHLLVTWAVPCFLMVSGALLLDPQKKIDGQKIGRYIMRMFCILASFGTGYALMELVVNERSISIPMVLRSILNVAEGKSWDHLWYIYTLIALYILTIPLKCFINQSDRKTLKYFIGILLFANLVIPLINALFDWSLERYMMLNQYATYYLLGYYLSSMKEVRYGLLYAIPGVIATLFMLISETLSLHNSCTQFAANHRDNILHAAQAVSVFMTAKHVYSSRSTRIPSFVKLIGKYSFGIYLIHPFWINLFYKILGLTPLAAPMPLIGFSIILFTVGAVALSIVSTYIVKKIPGLRKIV